MTNTYLEEFYASYNLKDLLQISLPDFHESKLAVLKVFYPKHKPNIIHINI